MDNELARRIEELEDKLWNDYHTVVELPDAIPDELRLKLVTEAYAEVQAEGNGPLHEDCPLCRMMAATDNWVRHFDFCSGWCPSCEIVDWWETAAENHSPEEIAWMKAHNDYPPDYDPDRSYRDRQPESSRLAH